LSWSGKPTTGGESTFPTFVEQAVHDYNNRPHHSLNELTPFEVLRGGKIDNDARSQQIELAPAIPVTEEQAAEMLLPYFLTPVAG
jgi:hypothetical protein